MLPAVVTILLLPVAERIQPELALQDTTGRLVSLLRSNHIAMPTDQPVIGDGDAWMSVQARHQRLTLGLMALVNQAQGGSSLQWARLERVWRHQKTGPGSEIGGEASGERLSSPMHFGGASSPGSSGLPPLFGGDGSPEDEADG